MHHAWREMQRERKGTNPQEMVRSSMASDSAAIFSARALVSAEKKRTTFLAFLVGNWEAEVTAETETNGEEGLELERAVESLLMSEIRSIVQRRWPSKPLISHLRFELKEKRDLLLLLFLEG